MFSLLRKKKVTFPNFLFIYIMIYICSHGNERKHWICPRPTLPFLLVIIVVCDFLLLHILFFYKAVLAPAPLQFLHLPCFLCSPSILLPSSWPSLHLSPQQPFWSPLPTLHLQASHSSLSALLHQRLTPPTA